MKPSGIVNSASDGHTTVPEFDSGLGKGHSTFHPSGQQNAYQVCWYLKVEGPALGLPPNRVICCISTQGPMPRKQVFYIVGPNTKGIVSLQA